MGFQRSLLGPGSATYAPIASVPTVVVGTGTADTAAVLAAFNTMKVSGKATGRLKLKGTIALDSALVLDGGYAAVSNSANWTSGSTERFVLDCSEALIVPAANLGVALTVKGFYGPQIDARFKGGGTSRSVADAAITAAAATLTSATAAFVSTDVGKVVRVLGASTNGQAPLVARISSVTNGTTAVLDTNATTTVSGAKCSIRDIGLRVENLIDADIDVYANGYAGLAFYHDAPSTATAVTQSTIRSIKALSCGQALYLAARQGSFGAIVDVWDDNCVDGSVVAKSSDVTIGHWESFAPGTQDNSLIIDNCNAIGAQVINLGDSATEALLKVVGGDVGDLGKIYATSAGTSRDGVLLVEVKSARLDVISSTCAAGVHMKGCGSNGILLRHRTLTNDVVGVKLDTGPATSTFQLVEIDGYWSFTGSQAILINSGLTGRVRAKGQIDSTCNQSGGASINLADCLSSNVVFDVTGLTALNNNGTVAASVHHTTPANLIGLDGVKLANGPGLASGAAPAGPEHLARLAWSLSPAVCSTAPFWPLNGNPIFTMVPVPYDMTITNINTYVYGAGVGLTNTFLGIFGPTGVQLGITADVSTTLQSTGRKAIPLTSPVKVTGGFGKYVYVAMLVNWATTAPKVPCGPVVVNSNPDQITGTQTTAHLVIAENTTRTALPAPWTYNSNTTGVAQVPYFDLT